VAVAGQPESVIARRDYKSDFARRYVAQGNAEGRAEEAKMILAVLSARGIAVPDQARTRITECADLEQLEAWVRPAATATSIEEVCG
jgi:hypothetical protein